MSGRKRPTWAHIRDDLWLMIASIGLATTNPPSWMPWPLSDTGYWIVVASLSCGLALSGLVLLLATPGENEE